MDYLASVGLESDPWEHRALYDVLEPHAREYSPALDAEGRRAYLRRLAERVFRRLAVRAPPAEAERHAAALWEILGPTSLVVFPEVPDVLAALRGRGFRLAIVSNWQCGLGHFCTELGLGGAFEHVVASAEVGSEKPDPGIFHVAFGRLGVEPDGVVHVGDTPRDDLEGARAAGCRGVLVSRGGPVESRAEAVIADLTELEALLSS